MAAIVIRNLSDDIHQALKARAAGNGRSAEAEVRAILDAALMPKDRVKLGSLLASIGREAGIGLAIPPRDRTPHRPVDLS